MIAEKGKRHHVLIKDLNMFLYNHTLHPRRKHFCHYCLQAFITEEILKCHIKVCFEINDKQRIIMPKTGECIKLKKIKSSLIVHADFESILVPENIGKQNTTKPYLNEFQSHPA